MNRQAVVQVQNTATSTLMLVRGKALQCKYACGQHTPSGGDSAECRKKWVGAFVVGARSLQRQPTNQAEPATADQLK